MNDSRDEPLLGPSPPDPEAMQPDLAAATFQRIVSRAEAASALAASRRRKARLAGAMAAACVVLAGALVARHALLARQPVHVAHRDGPAPPGSVVALEPAGSTERHAPPRKRTGPGTGVRRAHAPAIALRTHRGVDAEHSAVDTFRVVLTVRPAGTQGYARAAAWSSERGKESIRLGWSVRGGQSESTWVRTADLASATSHGPVLSVAVTSAPGPDTGTGDSP